MEAHHAMTMNATHFPAKRLAFGLAVIGGIAAPVVGAEPWPIESEAFVFSFAVEADQSDIQATWPGAQPIDTAHHDLSFIYDGCGNGFRNAILRVPGTLLDANVWYVPVVPSNAFDASIFGPAFDFIGIDDDTESVWVLTQTNLPGTVFLGTSTEDVPTAARNEIASWLPDDTRPGRQSANTFVGFELVDVRGPEGGDFALYRTGDQSGPTVMLSTAMPEVTTANNVVHEFVGGHTHYFWAFTEPGLYEVLLSMRTVINLPPTGVAPDFTGVSEFVHLPFDVTCDGAADAFDVSRVLSSLSL